MGCEPVAQGQKARDRGLELGDVLGTLAVGSGHPHAGGHLGLVDVEPRRALDDCLRLNLLDVGWR